MKTKAILMMGCVFVTIAQGEIVSFEGLASSETTTGETLDSFRDGGITTQVLEIDNLLISARSGGESQELNATGGDEGSFGINTASISDETDAFESGEKLILSFDKDIQISRIDFNRLGSAETFSVAIAGQSTIVVEYDDLAQKQFGWFDTSLMISANTEIEFYTTGTSVVGLDSITMQVIPEPAVLGLVLLVGSGAIALRRFML